VPHPSYQAGFFKPGSPIANFMADRNQSTKKKENTKSAPTKQRNMNNPYYKLLDWSALPDQLGLEIAIEQGEERYVK